MTLENELQAAKLRRLEREPNKLMQRQNSTPTQHKQKTN